MKNVFAALVLVLTTASSFATHREDLRLVFQTRPNGMVAGGRTEQVVVLNNGSVQVRSLQAIQNGFKKKEIARLTAEEMDGINRLIDDASEAGTIYRKNTILCIVAPMTVSDYLADNGKVVLKSGHACEGWKLNESRAAFHLIRKLDALRKLAQTGVADETNLNFDLAN